MLFINHDRVILIIRDEQCHGIIADGDVDDVILRNFHVRDDGEHAYVEEHALFDLEKWDIDTSIL